MEDKLKLVIITGMSGAGKTVAMQCFEDMGYFCIDNMPPGLFTKFLEVVRENGAIKKIAMVVDLRSRSFFKESEEMLEKAQNMDSLDFSILFLDASEEELVSRYKETRRNHPLAQDGRILEGIQKEKEMLYRLREEAQVVIDTSHLSARELKEKILEIYQNATDNPFHLQLMSFGFKHGIPIDADVVMDVRFLPNPYYIDNLRDKTGEDAEVYDYVMSFPETEEFYEKLKSLLDTAIPGYQEEGKKSVTIAIGCTGGHHRSVAITERLSHDFKEEGYIVNTSHRDKLID